MTSKEENLKSPLFKEKDLRPLLLFILIFQINKDIGRIYDVKVIYDIVVKIEPLKKTSILIPQYKRYQGLAQRYCQLNQDFITPNFITKMLLALNV